MKIAFDIGGVISRYPNQMKELMHDLWQSGNEIYILTDMNQVDAIACINENDLNYCVGDLFDRRPERILSADWSKYGDRCKTVLMDKHDIDILIDDRPDYCAEGGFIGLTLSPRPGVPYYHETWINRSTPAVMVPPEEYEEFKKWRELNK